jgi:type I restriction enzyme R subunit
MREVVEYILGLIPRIKDRGELADEAFDRFDTRVMPPEEYFADARNVFTAYLLDPDFRHIIDTGSYAHLNVHPNGAAFQRIPPALCKAILDYIKDYVPLNQFATAG